MCSAGGLLGHLLRVKHLAISTPHTQGPVDRSLRSSCDNSYVCHFPLPCDGCIIAPMVFEGSNVRAHWPFVVDKILKTRVLCFVKTTLGNEVSVRIAGLVSGHLLSLVIL